MAIRRTLLLTAAATLALAAITAPAQPPPPPAPPGIRMPDKPDPSVQIPSFDVVSVKPDTANGGMMRLMFTADGLSLTNVPVHMILTEGYHLNDDQIFDEPAWAKSDRFDVEAKVAGPDVATLKKLTPDQRRSMFKQVLTDRFQIKTHTETRTLPVYVLSIAKSGSKLAVASPRHSLGRASAAVPSAPGSPAPVRPRGPGMMMQRGKLTVTDSPLAFFLQFLSRELGRTIVDKTGLTGNYDFTLSWTPDEGTGSAGPGGPPPAGAPSPAPPPDSSGGPSIFTAIQEQLGLKLESKTKGPVDTSCVIDHLEKPTEN